MKLYCITIFLNNENIIRTIKQCDDSSLNYKQLQVTDHIGTIVDGYQIDISGLMILLLPCNDFHKNKDFEIGITAESLGKWKYFLENDNKNGLEIEEGDFKDDTDTCYALLKDNNYHGPFFFIFDTHYSEEKVLEKIICTVEPYDYKLYDEKIKHVIEGNISEKLEIKEGTAFKIEKIIVTRSEDVIIFDYQ